MEAKASPSPAASTQGAGAEIRSEQADKVPQLPPLTIDTIEGGWRVVASSRARSDLKGAIAEIYPEAVTWSYLPKGAQVERQFCREPLLEDLSAERSKSTADGLAAPLLKGTKQPAQSQVHELKCAKGGEWGPASGTDMILLEDGSLRIGWMDGETLTLRRLDRVAPKDNMQPEDYAADTVR